jgi:hypothetical protein
MFESLIPALISLVLVLAVIFVVYLAVHWLAGLVTPKIPEPAKNTLGFIVTVVDVVLFVGALISILRFLGAVLGIL